MLAFLCIVLSYVLKSFHNMLEVSLFRSRAVICLSTASLHHIIRAMTNDNPMLLSQPRTARQINRYRVLNALWHSSSFSKASLAKALDLNKVSTGEIVEGLKAEGLVRDQGFLESSNGRPAARLELIKDARYIVTIHLGSRMISASIANLAAETLRFERQAKPAVKKPEEYVGFILRLGAKLLSACPEAKVLGVIITANAAFNEDCTSIIDPVLGELPLVEGVRRILKVPSVLMPSSKALIRAEREILSKDFPSSTVAYLDWSDAISCALVIDGKIAALDSSIGHLKVEDTGLCTCGSIGCLQAQVSSWALTGKADGQLSSVFEAGISDKALCSMAKAMAVINCVTGARHLIIGGQGASIDKAALTRLQAFVDSQRIKGSVPMELMASRLKDKAQETAAANAGLDELLFKTSLIQDLGFNDIV